MVEITCAACGRVFTENVRKRKYCDVCKKLSQEKRSALARQREEQAAADYEAMVLLRRKENHFDLSWKSLARVDAEAKLFNMTYGTYTAACRCGFISQILKNKGFAEPEKLLEQLDKEHKKSPD